MTSSASSGERKLRAIVVSHFGRGVIYEAVHGPCAVLKLLEAQPCEIASAFRAGIHIHVPLIALIDPAL